MKRQLFTGLWRQGPLVLARSKQRHGQLACTMIYRNGPTLGEVHSSPATGLQECRPVKGSTASLPDNFHVDSWSKA